MMLDATAPFVLLDDARDGGAAGWLYRGAIELVETRDPAEVLPSLHQLRDGTRRGLHAAGFISYEAGHALEPKLAPLRGEPVADAPPLLWFGLFETAERVDDVPALLPDPGAGWTSVARPLIDRSAYEASVERIREHIYAGDVYQANLTFPAEVRTAGNPIALYAGLRRRSRAGHGALVFTGAHWLLSSSPELFFTLGGGKVSTRPMKGTAVRRRNPAEDAAEVEKLKADPKQRAENLMIVDLLRNDLSRVSKPGTVKVPSLFTVETYPTVHQMTSTVNSELQEGVDAVGLVEAIFPCGSITGAPKIRAMEIIHREEQRQRGIYTGSIGRIGPDGGAEFNVAIRTLTIRAGEDRATIGLGSGIVADSCAADEWLECLTKGAFVSDPDRRFDLIETMRFDPHDGIAEAERHLGRMKRSADQLGFAFDRHGARNELQAATFHLREAKSVRLLLSHTGAVAIEVRPLPAPPSRAVKVALVPLPVSSDDFRLRHKTSDRGFYDDARGSAGTWDVLFEDAAGFLTEGSFTNLFVAREGKLLTPPLTRGLLPGVLRERLLETGEAVEADLVAADLVNGFFLGNAVRGLVPGVLA
jgi:para-aminobenzoate synthetase/4-amino-4-deoxychorismate lyase